jgi:hypothetical protein
VKKWGSQAALKAVGVEPRLVAYFDDEPRLRYDERALPTKHEQSRATFADLSPTGRRARLVALAADTAPAE